MQLAFRSGGKDIRIDVGIPPQDGMRPAVLVLHGSGGATDLPDQVRDLAERGYVTLAPHYFESTGTSWADLDSIRRHGLSWGKTILDAVEFARQLSNVDPESIGLLGYSLGGFLAVAVAAHDLRIKCVVEFFGGLPEKFLPTVDHLPPTLILHGEDDRIVPIHHAMRLKRLCEEKRFCFEMEIYPGAGHNFSGPLMRTAMERTMIFLGRRLQAQHSAPVLGGPA
jgi:carboxymethylenebutenolidase